MGGANFMGGRKNAAKKRFKDPATRLEKRFFGRQKLNILSKPIPTNPAKILKSSSDIGFTHARRRTASMEGTGRIEGPDRRFEEVRLSSEGSENRNSKVLEALDTFEPLSSRAAMDQILSLPDLAGLTRTKRPRPNDIPILPPKSKRRREHSSVDATTRENIADQSTRNTPEYSGSSTGAFVFGGRSIRSLTRENFTGNVFEYDDPWRAAGIVLGVETASSDGPSVASSRSPILVQPKRPLAYSSDTHVQSAASYSSPSPNYGRQSQPFMYDADLPPTAHPAMFDLPTSSPPSRTVSSVLEIPIASYGDEVELDSRDYTAIFGEEQPADMDSEEFYEEEEVSNQMIAASSSNHSRLHYESRSSVHNEYHSSSRQDSSASRLQYGNDDFSSWIHVPSEDPDMPYVDAQDVVSENEFSEFSSWVDLPSASSAPRKPSSPLFKPLAKSDDVFSMSIASRNGAARLGFLKLPMSTPKPVKNLVPLPEPPAMRSVPLGTRQRSATRYSPVQVPLGRKAAMAMNDTADFGEAQDVRITGSIDGERDDAPSSYPGLCLFTKAELLDSDSDE